MANDYFGISLNTHRPLLGKLIQPHIQLYECPAMGQQLAPGTGACMNWFLLSVDRPSKKEPCKNGDKQLGSISKHAALDL